MIGRVLRIKYGGHKLTGALAGCHICLNSKPWRTSATRKWVTHQKNLGRYIESDETVPSICVSALYDYNNNHWHVRTAKSDNWNDKSALKFINNIT